MSVVGIAEACIEDPDALLRELLVTAISDLAVRIGKPPAVGTVDRAQIDRELRQLVTVR